MDIDPLTLDDIEALAVGAWILGAGGGGSPYLGLLNMRRRYAEGHRVSGLAARVAWRDAAPIAMSPDLICVLDTVSGEAFGTGYGRRVSVIALPAPPVFLTPKGLDHVGPRAFGYDLDFRSAFEPGRG
jgi:DUF917 family protein